jgi:hypothetical protein
LNASANANANAPTAESAVSVERGVRSTASAGVPLSDVGCRMSECRGLWCRIVGRGNGRTVGMISRRIVKRLLVFHDTT